MNKILALWAVPRSTSTAFEWMMRVRGDLDCYHEPFGEAWYQGEEPLWPRLGPDSLRTPGLTLESVWGMLQVSATKKPIFIKDFPHYLSHDSFYATKKFLDNFRHSFLIRDPAKTITSMFKHWKEFHPIEVGFKEQRELFDRLCDLYGEAPPVLDSDDLLEDPHKMVEKYCNAVGLPFLPESLSWEPGNRDEVSWWNGGSFHENLRNSNGLKPQIRKYIDISEAPDRVKRVYDSVLPHYETLYPHRI